MTTASPSLVPDDFTGAPWPIRLLTPFRSLLGFLYGLYLFSLDLTLRIGLTSLFRLRFPWQRTAPAPDVLRMLLQEDPPYGKHRTLTLDGGRSFHCVETGPTNGTLVLMLHGFPQCWYMWRHQLEALQDGRAGNYHVVAVDLKGFGGSYKPTAVEEYAIDRLVQDVEDIVHALGHNRCTLVGHDFGGVIAWACAALRPTLVDRLLVVNAPHVPQLFRSMYRVHTAVPWSTTIKQWLRLWYTFIYKLPGPCGRISTTWADYMAIRGAVMRHGAATEAEAAVYAAAFAIPGVTDAAFNYYRISLQPVAGIDRVIQAPTLVVWCDADVALDMTANLDGLEAYTSDLQICQLSGLHHFSLESHPKRANELLIEFLKYGNEQVHTGTPAKQQ